MTRGLLHRWTVTLLAAMWCASAAWASPTSVRVVSGNDYPPYLFLDANGRPQGYLVDLWALWSRKTGTPVDLQPMAWQDALTAIREGQADVIDIISRNPVREQLYDFSEAYGHQNLGIYVDHAIQGVHDTRSLQGFQIGVVRASACVDRLSSQGVTDLAAYASNEALIDGARTGAIKIFCMDDNPANYYLYLSREQVQFAKAFTLATTRLHWAVRRGDEQTLAQVTAGMALITPQEREALHSKWFSNPVQFQPYWRIAGWGALIGLTLLAVLGLWVHSLRRAVQARTAELNEKNLALRLEHAQLRTLVESSPDAMWLKDVHGVYMDCNAHLSTLFGLTREQVIGHTAVQLSSNEAVLDQTRSDALVVSTGEPQRSEVHLAEPAGDGRDFEVIRVPIRAPDGTLSGILGVARDVTARKLADRELRIAAAAFEGQQGMLVTDGAAVIQRVNASFTRMMGYTAEDLVGQTPRAFKSSLQPPDFYERMWAEIHESGAWAGTLWNHRKDGSLCHVRLTVSAIRDGHGRVAHYVGTFSDLTGETEAKARVAHLERFDALTDLPNRTVLEERITDMLQQGRSGATVQGALLLFDLDEFSVINNVHGRRVGDQLLQQSAQRLWQLLPRGATLARFTSDEFAVLVPGAAAAPEFILDLAQRMQAALAEPHPIEGAGPLTCTASVGVTLAQGPARGADALLAEVELATAKAKTEGHQSVRLFVPEMQVELDARSLLERDMRAGLQAGQFVLYEQPQVDDQGCIVGVEALVRWVHPQRGLIPPGAFIPVAERSGLIELLGTWILQEACRVLARWKDNPLSSALVLSVNVSPRQFRQPDFVQRVQQALDAAGADPARLMIEVTESMAMLDIDNTVDKLHQIKRMGVRIALDDFGTGNSSLSYLTRLPLDQIKIDQSFVRNLPDAENDALMTQTILSMARGLGFEVVAEGVETAAQWRMLGVQGCRVFQGYLFARPMTLDAFEALLSRGPLQPAPPPGAA